MPLNSSPSSSPGHSELLCTSCTPTRKSCWSRRERREGLWMALMCGSPAGELPMETGTQGCAEAAQPSCGVRGCGARLAAAQGLCVCCVCASPGQETCSRGCLATEERSSCAVSACCRDVKFVIPSCRGVEACTGAHSVSYVGQQHRLMLM